MATEAPEVNGHVEDPEDSSQTERIGTILRRRDEVLEARDRAKDQFTLGDIDKGRAVMHYQSRLETLLIDISTKFEAELAAAETDYFGGVDIATVRIAPPESLTREADLAPGVSPPEPVAFVIEGLSWFINNDPVVSHEFSVRAWNPPREIRESAQVVLDFRHIDQAVMQAFQFLDEIGLDVEMRLQDYHADEGPGI
jgi:hypothetical protein